MAWMDAVWADPSKDWIWEDTPPVEPDSPSTASIAAVSIVDAGAPEAAASLMSIAGEVTNSPEVGAVVAAVVGVAVVVDTVVGTVVGVGVGAGVEVGVGVGVGVG